MVPAKGKATSITEDFAESKIPSANNLNMLVSPKKTSLQRAIIKAITKKAIQIIFKAIILLFMVLI
jgi:hypothetical protein